MKRKGKEGDNLVLRIELLFELGDFTLFGGGEVLGIVSTHLAPFFCFLTLLDSDVNVDGRCRGKDRFSL